MKERERGDKEEDTRKERTEERMGEAKRRRERRENRPCDMQPCSMKRGDLSNTGDIIHLSSEHGPLKKREDKGREGKAGEIQNIIRLKE